MKTIKLFSSSARHRFLLLMLFTLFTCVCAWGAGTPGSGYTAITASSSLSNGDYVVLCSSTTNNKCISGWNGSTTAGDATASTTPSEWVKYRVTNKNGDNFKLYDEAMGGYITYSSNYFRYNSSGTELTITGEGKITIAAETDRKLYGNSGYIRWYSSSKSEVYYVFKANSAPSIDPVYVKCDNIEIDAGTYSGSTITGTTSSAYTITHTFNSCGMTWWGYVDDDLVDDGLGLTLKNSSGGNFSTPGTYYFYHDDDDGCYVENNYFKIYYTVDGPGTYTGYIVFTDYNEQYIYVEVTVTATAGCTTDPTIGTASIGSVTLTSLTGAVTVSSGTCSPGSSGCTWTDLGFVWGTSSNPTVSNNKKQYTTSGTATSFSTSIQPSGSTTPTAWVVGTTYYVRTYGKNAKAEAAYNYGTQTSFVLRSITFNSNGGSSVGTIYPKSGGTATQPSNPTKTGYTFGGWYQEAELTNAVNWSSTITANKTYYAKWTAKTCTVTFDKNSGTGGDNSVTATYGSAMPTITAPTRTGYTFGGYYNSETSNNGTGTKYYNADGTSARNWDVNTTSGQTLYANWTANTYTVQWKVNGVIYSAGGSTTVDHDSKVSTLPTAPNPATYCSGADVFVGWTTAADGTYVHGTSPLFTTAGDAPTATGNQVFHAVFADYAE